MRNLFKCLIVYVLSLMFTSCEDKSLTIASNAADFVVTNLMTGETLRNKESGMVVKNGDILNLVYTPSKDFQNYSWYAEFELFDRETKTVSKSPYSCMHTVENMSVGEYKISVTARVKGSEETTSDYGYVEINLVE